MKKSNRILWGTTQEKIAFAITSLRQYPISKVCNILKLPLSSYYYQLHHPSVQRYTEAEKTQVSEVFKKHHGSFGRRMLHRELPNISEYRISKIMKSNQLFAKYGRKKGKNVYTSTATEPIYIKENFYRQLTKEERQTKEIWSMDFSEIKIQGRKMYACGIISTNSKVLTNLIISRKCDAQLAVEAVQNAIKKYGPPDMITTDRGTQFTSKTFSDIIQSHNITHSMSRPHTPIDNCYIETFWKSFKIEMGDFSKRSECELQMIVEYYEHYYNYIRLHSTLGYIPPLQVYRNEHFEFLMKDVI
ncbi:MAG: IS3 family transposase [Oscillospiraceae bacterium]